MHLVNNQLAYKLFNCNNLIKDKYKMNATMPFNLWTTNYVKYFNIESSKIQTIKEDQIPPWTTNEN